MQQAQYQRDQILSQIDRKTQNQYSKLSPQQQGAVTRFINQQQAQQAQQAQQSYYMQKKQQQANVQDVTQKIQDLYQKQKQQLQQQQKGLDNRRGYMSMQQQYI